MCRSIDLYRIYLPSCRSGSAGGEGGRKDDGDKCAGAGGRGGVECADRMVDQPVAIGGTADRCGRRRLPVAGDRGQR